MIRDHVVVAHAAQHAGPSAGNMTPSNPPLSAFHDRDLRDWQSKHGREVFYARHRALA